jgi:hypothetical protein
LYEYLNTIVADVPLIKATHRVSSLVQLEETLSNLRQAASCALLVRDSGDGHLDLRDKRLNTGYYNFYIMCQASVNDHASRLAAKRLAMQVGIFVFDRMRKDTNDFGDPAYGFDDRRIDYSEIGPIGNNYFGYSFGFTVQQGFETLFNSDALPEGTYLADESGSFLTDNDDNFITE